MTRNRNFRARTTYKNKNRVMGVATELNGAEPNGFHDALEVVCRYITVLDRHSEVSCPNCGEVLEEKGGGHYFHCWHEDRYLDVFDVIGSENPDDARVFGLPTEVKSKFECDCDDGQAGMIAEESRQDTATGTSNTTKPGQYHQDGPLDW